jgi:PAS domain S-box-containing protein
MVQFLREISILKCEIATRCPQHLNFALESFKGKPKDGRNQMMEANTTPPSRLHRLKYYILALLLVTLGVIVRVVLTHLAGPGLPTYIRFYPFVMLAALVGGWGPGLLATLATVVAVDYWFLLPVGLFKIDRFVDIVGMVFFSAMGVFMTTVAGLYRHTRNHLEEMVILRTKALSQANEKLQEQREELQSRTDELTAANVALRKSEARCRSYVEVTEQLGWTTNGDGEVVEDAPAWRKFTGQSEEEVKGWGWSKALYPDDLEPTARAWRDAVARKSNYEVESRIRRYDGVYRNFLARGVPVLKDNGDVLEWVGTCIDITERKLAEEKERKEHEETSFANRILRLFVEYEGDELFDRALAVVQEGMVSKHGVFGYIAEPGHLICPSLSKMLDECEIEGKCIHYPPEKWKGLWARALKEKRSVYTNVVPPVPPGHPIIHNNLATPILFREQAIGLLNLANKEGGYAEEDREMLDAIAARMAPVLYAWIQRKLRDDERKRAEEALKTSRDELEIRVQERTSELARANKELQEEMARREKAEEQLRQAQKLESIGTLAGGIAHDINNILGPIVINSEMALLDLPTESVVRKNIEMILTSGLRGKDLVRQMLLFSRKSEKKQKVLPLSPVIKETFKLLRSSLPTTIQMRLLIETESDTVYADPSQIQQVIMNLCTNAAYAMRGKTGSIDISLQGITFGSHDLPEADMQTGDYVVLSVKDTGMGMDEKVRKRAFEPFFTTKPVGEGTGLGLAVVYGTVRSHKGNITVYSEPGKGSIFRVYLPKADTGVSQKAEPPRPIPGGKERILFVDDEETIVHSVRNMLKHLGYKVTALTDSEEALGLFSERPSEFDLVMTDQTMPLMTGEILGRELMRIRPDIPIILCTGFSDLISSEKAMAMGFRGFIMKPFTLRESAELVRRVLDQKDPNSPE